MATSDARVDTSIVATMVVAPAYDDVSRLLSTAVQEAWPQGGRIARVLIGSHARRDTIVQFLTAEVDVLLVFVGHGDDDALLTAPNLSALPARREDHAVLCRAEDFATVERATVVAFCCRALRRFGRGLSTDRQASVLGFTDDLPIHFGTPTREGAFKAPVGTVVDAFHAGVDSVGDVAALLTATYDSLIEEWTFFHADDPEAMIVAMMLDMQFIALTMIATR